MPYLKRSLCLNELLKTRSVFLFGPRQSGKSTYIREQLIKEWELPGSGSELKLLASYNLLDQKIYLNLSQNLTLIREELKIQQAFTSLQNQNQKGVVIIDEIQKIPQLLDEVHLMIEEMGLHFLLTGSSARSLKRKGVNLLGGRARVRNFHPLVTSELGDSFDLEQAMFCGLLPSHYFSDLPDEDLQAYVGQYLQTEIAAEGISRNIPAFARFLEVAGLCSGEMLNYSSVASDAQVTRQTVQNYFQVLEDTLLGFMLPPWTKSKKRKAIGTPKFYLFDMGVMRTLRGLGEISRNSSDFGVFFEHFIFHELRAYLSYHFPAQKIYYWRSTSQFEVDFLLGSMSIEVKSSSLISEKHLKGLKAFKEENISKKYLIICFESKKRILDSFEIYPWKDFLRELWHQEFDSWINFKKR